MHSCILLYCRNYNVLSLFAWESTSSGSSKTARIWGLWVSHIPLIFGLNIPYPLIPMSKINNFPTRYPGTSVQNIHNFHYFFPQNILYPVNFLPLIESHSLCFECVIYCFRNQTTKISRFFHDCVCVSSHVSLTVTLTVLLPIASWLSGFEFLVLNVEFQTKSPACRIWFSFHQRTIYLLQKHPFVFPMCVFTTCVK